MTDSKSIQMNAKIVRDAFNQSAKLKKSIVKNKDIVDSLVSFGIILTKSISDGNKVLIFGNGGSAADAQHLAAEMIGTYIDENHALPAIALTVDTSVITAVSNDIGYESIFARQIQGLGLKGDIALGITTSGSSQNVVNGLLMAKDKGMITAALTGENVSELSKIVDYLITIPSSNTQRIQEAHGTIIHILCDLIKSDFK